MARLLVWGILLAGSAAANDIVYLNGKVTLENGAAPGKSVLIELSCQGSDPVRQTNSSKKGTYYLKVERDEFNHIARALPAAATDMNGAGSVSGPCALIGDLKGYDSSRIDLSNFTIGKDLKLPDMVLKAKSK
jgi:hypothetical protein